VIEVAETHRNQHRYLASARLLEQVPESLRDDACGRLLDEVSRKAREVTSLAEQIKVAQRAGDPLRVLAPNGFFGNWH
jgi:hypothetical protein